MQALMKGEPRMKVYSNKTREISELYIEVP